MFMDFLMIATVTNVRWYLIVALICVSLVISQVEHLFKYLLAICMSSLKKCLFRSSAHFFEWVVCFDAVKHHELFVNFGRLIPYWSHRLQCFLPICGLSFILFIVSFAVQQLLSLSMSHLFIFVYISIILGDRLKKYCCNLCQSVMLPVFYTVFSLSLWLSSKLHRPVYCPPPKLKTPGF